MAQTWPFSRKRRAILKAADFVGRAVTRPFRPKELWTGGEKFPARILLIEPWNIGDVVLATPILRELRRRYPDAEISILAKPHARELLEGSGWVDDVIPFNLPWTEPRNKYQFDAATMGRMRALIRALRARRFDLTLDARMDIRSNLLAAATGAKRRLGYDVGGGGWLLTDALPSERDQTHKVDDWLALLALLDGSTKSAAIDHTKPRLVVTEAERLAARKAMRLAAGEMGPTIGYHPGGSHPGKRWPLEQFVTLARDLSQSLAGRHVVFLGPGDEDSGAWPNEVTVLRPALRELMALLTCCDVLVCNDSGPMHIADALGVPVVAVFEVGNPKWFGPSGPRATVIAGENAGIGVSAAPLDNPPSNPVAVSRVAEAVRETLGP